METMKRALFILVFTAVTVALVTTCVHAEKGDAMVIELAGTINPSTAQFVKKGLERAQNEGYGLAIIRLDTPGGLDTSMRTIVKSILNSSMARDVFLSSRKQNCVAARHKVHPTEV